MLTHRFADMVRCPGCRTRRATFVSMLKHVDKTGHKVCECGHGRHYPHRPGSGGCVQEKWDDVLDMPRAKNLGNRCPF